MAYLACERNMSLKHRTFLFIYKFFQNNKKQLRNDFLQRLLISHKKLNLVHQFYEFAFFFIIICLSALNLCQYSNDNLNYLLFFDSIKCEFQKQYQILQY